MKSLSNLWTEALSWLEENVQFNVNVEEDSKNAVIQGSISKARKRIIKLKLGRK